MRGKNDTRRGREHLTPEEVERLARAAAGLGRHGARDAAMIRTAFIHGLRAGELLGLRRDQLDLEGATVIIRRLKHGTDSTHPMPGREVRELRKVLRAYPEGRTVFVNERGGPVSVNGFGKVVARAGLAARLPLSAHPHMLRHSCGYKLAADGRDTRAIQLYLGHRNIQHTVRYTAMAPDRFKGFWRG